MKRIIAFTGVLVLGAIIVAWAAAPTTLNDFFMPGSQPGQSGNIEHPSKCDNCHGGYDLAVEPAYNWRGSMMSQAARDPLFYACLAIANQDAPESGDLCIRCHAPDGWLQGRSVPTDGSALNSGDREGVQCDFCHKLVKPTPLGVNPYPNDADYLNGGTYTEDQSYLSILSQIPPTSADGMYIADNNNAKRGPFVDAAARHQMFYSPFHKDAAMCGTCHDVSNPALAKQPDGTYMPNDFDAPATNFDPYTMFPIERTFSEWTMSAYNTIEGVYAPQFGGNKDTVHTCQDCHLHDVTGVGCNKNGAPLRSDLPLHDMTGGNTFIPALVKTLYPGEIDPAALDAGVARATGMLQKAASMDLNVTPATTGYLATVRVTNETAHKLPSGYPEGRRIWLNLKVYDATGALITEYGAYDAATGDLIHDTKVYEIKPGLSDALAAAVGLPPGVGFHFVLNNQIFSDNRIPPRGFSNANFELIQSPPVGYTYADGQYWDDSEFSIPDGAAQVVATLFYQTTSKEYVEFLRDENVTDNTGQTLYDLWVANGKSAPVAMNTATFDITPTDQPPTANFAGDPVSGTAPLTVQFTDLSAGSPTSWSWDFGDGGTSDLQNPTHDYPAAGLYTVSLTATNSFGSDTKTINDYITVTEPGTTPVMHVANIVVTRQSAGGPNRIGVATVTIHDQNDLPVADATVIGLFNAPDNTIMSGVTGADGVAVLTSNKTRNTPTDWCFEVTNVSKTGASYDASANLVTTACESGPAAKMATSGLPGAYMLAQNHPNPFNPQTEISLYLENPAHVTIAVFNVLGQKMATLVDEQLGTGHHDFVWDGSHAASGVYFYRAQIGQNVETRKMVLQK